MDRLAENHYELDIDRNQMKKLGFRYDHSAEDYTYKFPVYKHNGIPLVFCKVGIDEETKRVWFNVCDTNDTLYAPYYDRMYGKNTMIDNIEDIIAEEFARLGIVKVN